MAQTLLDKAIVSVYETGFFDYALPFMVTFVVVYGILQKTKLFGKEAAKFNAIFALVSSLTVLPFVSQVDYTTYLSKLVFFMFAVFALAMILGLLGYKFENKGYATVFAFISILIIVGTEYFGIASLGDLFKLRSEFVYVLIIVLFFVMISWMISAPSEKIPKKPVEEKKRKAPEAPPQRELQEEPQQIPISQEELQDMLSRRQHK